MSEYTPSAEKLQEAYEYWVAGLGGSDGREVERFLAAHDRELREQVAKEIEATETLLLHVEDFDKHRESIQGQINGIRAATRIARGEGSE